MPRVLKVYGWRSSRGDCPPAPNGSKQVRYIVAAPSWVAAVKAVAPYESASHAAKYGSVTANDAEIAQAMSEPGTAFWIPTHEEYNTTHNWRRV